MITLQQLQEQIERLQALDRPRPVVARYATASGQSIPNNTTTIVNFDTATFDPDGHVSPGAAWKFTAKIAGYYHVDATVMFALSTAWAAGETAELNLFKNGGFVSCVGRNDSMNSGAVGQYKRLVGIDLIFLAVADYIDFRIGQTSGGTLTIHPSANYSFLSIHKIN